MSPGEKETTAEIKRICLACGQTFTDVTRCPKDGNPLVMIKRKDSMIGQVLGGCYEVQALLGRGGMSTVYKGRHTMMNRLVALKVLSSHDPYSLKRFHMEAQLAASLSHANIITVYDFGLAKDGEAYLAMDYIAGKTLAETVASGGPMDFKRAIPMFEQACDALAYAHSKGVIHRDLKPSNFLISSGSDGEDVIKLLDFGIAKQLEPGENYKTLTATGQVFGSPLYMSPEQCMGLKLDPRADVYSLGCVMYEVLTGLPPFIGKTPLDTMQMHVHEDAKPPSRAESLPVMPERLEEIILKAVERDIEHRYQSIFELWNDLKELDKDHGRLANSEIDTAQIYIDKKEKEQQIAYADTDPNSVSMQQLQLMTPKLDNLAKDLQQGSLFDTRLNNEIDQRIKSGLAVETDEDDEPPVVALDVTRQTIALLNELQKSSGDLGSQLLADRSDRAPTGSMQAVAAPQTEPGQTVQPDEFAGAVETTAAAAEINNSSQLEKTLDEEVATNETAQPQENGEGVAETSGTAQPEEKAEKGEAVDTNETEQPKEVAEISHAEATDIAKPNEVAEISSAEAADIAKPNEVAEISASAEAADIAKPNEISQKVETAESSDSDSHQFRRPRAFNGPVFRGSVNLSPLQGSIKLGASIAKQSAADFQPEPTTPQSVLDTGDLPPVTEVVPTKQFPSTMPSPDTSETPTVPAATVEPEPAPADASPLSPNSESIAPSSPDSESTAPPIVPSTEPQAAPVTQTPTLSLAAVQAKTGAFIAHIPEHMSAAPTAYIVAFIVIALLTFAYAVCAVHRP